MEQVTPLTPDPHFHDRIRRAHRRPGSRSFELKTGDATEDDPRDGERREPGGGEAPPERRPPPPRPGGIGRHIDVVG